MASGSEADLSALDESVDDELESARLKTEREQQRLVRHKAVDLLSRREHSRFELVRKLRQREFPDDVVEQVLDLLEQKNYLSDRRFATQFAEQRLKKGYGEQAVRASLSGRGIDSVLAADAIREVVLKEEVDWIENARQLLQRKFRNVSANTITDRVEIEKLRQRQARILRQRGFSTDQTLRAITDFWSVSDSASGASSDEL